MKMKEFLKNFALFLITIIIFMFFLEIALRLFHPQNLSRTQLDKDFLFSNRENLDEVRYSRFNEFEQYLSTNSKGLRDNEYNYIKQSDTIRILMLGDSFVEGVEVGFENTTSEILEKILNQSINQSTNQLTNQSINYSRKYEVINMGVSGYGTSQELAYLEKEGVKYNPDIVVLHFFVKNDLLDNEQKAVYFYNSSNNSLEKVQRKFSLFQKFWAFSIAHSNTANLIANVLLQNKAIGKMLHKIDLLDNHQFEKLEKNSTSVNLSYTKDIYYDNPPKEIQDSWKKTIVYLNQMHKISEKYNFSLFIVFIPAKEQVDLSAYKTFIEQEQLDEKQINIFAPNQIMDQYALASGILYFDSTLQFKEVNKQQKLYFVKDGHYGEMGHKLLAQLLYEELINENLIK